MSILRTGVWANLTSPHCSTISPTSQRCFPSTFSPFLYGHLGSASLATFLTTEPSESYSSRMAFFWCGFWGLNRFWRVLWLFASSTRQSRSSSLVQIAGAFRLVARAVSHIYSLIARTNLVNFKLNHYR